MGEAIARVRKDLAISVAQQTRYVSVDPADLRALLAALDTPPQATRGDRELLTDIAAMMSEFVDNWPTPKKVETALKLIAKTMRAALDDKAAAKAALLNPPKHRFWGAGEEGCPQEIRAGNGEIHTLLCKVCGQRSPRNQICLAALDTRTQGAGE